MGAFIPVTDTVSVGYYQIGEVILDRDSLVFNYITKSGQNYRVQCADKAEFDSRLDDLVSFGVSPASVRALSDGKVSADGLSARGYLVDVLDLGVKPVVSNGKAVYDIRSINNLEVKLDEPVKSSTYLGQTSYRKAIRIPRLPSMSELFVSPNLPADATLVGITGHAYNPELDVTIPLPYSNQVVLYYSGPQNSLHPRTLCIETKDDYSKFIATITLEYTRSE